MLLTSGDQWNKQQEGAAKEAVLQTDSESESLETKEGQLEGERWASHGHNDIIVE